MTANRNGNDIVAARFYGISFILAFLSYGFGNAMIESGIVNLGSATEASFDYRLAIISVAIIHTFANIGVVTVMYAILSRYSRFLVIGYLALSVIATASLLVGGGLLALIPQANGLGGEFSCGYRGAAVQVQFCTLPGRYDGLGCRRHFDVRRSLAHETGSALATDLGICRLFDLHLWHALRVFRQRHWCFNVFARWFVRNWA